MRHFNNVQQQLGDMVTAYNRELPALFTSHPTAAVFPLIVARPLGTIHTFCVEFDGHDKGLRESPQILVGTDSPGNERNAAQLNDALMRLHPIVDDADDSRVIRSGALCVV